MRYLIFILFILSLSQSCFGPGCDFSYGLPSTSFHGEYDNNEEHILCNNGTVSKLARVEETGQIVLLTEFHFDGKQRVAKLSQNNVVLQDTDFIVFGRADIFPAEAETVLYADLGVGVNACNQFFFRDSVVVSVRNHGDQYPDHCGFTGDDFLSVHTIRPDNLGIVSEKVQTPGFPQDVLFDQDLMFVQFSNGGFAIYRINDDASIFLMYENGSQNVSEMTVSDQILVIRNENIISQYDYSDLENITLLSSLEL